MGRNGKRALAAAVVGSGALAWGWFEAGWPRHRVLELSLDVPAALDGLRIGHLSDFHLGVRGRGPLSVEQGVGWIEQRKPDLVCLTGDLLSRPRGEAQLREFIRRLGHPYVVLGNHDVAHTRDPFSRAIELEALERATLLRNEAVDLELRGRRVQIVGVDARSYPRGRARPAELADPSADFRILLCHFPGIARKLPPGAFHLVLSGHLHAGQINLPYPGGKLHLAHPRAREGEGVYRYLTATLHVSPGLGTTFVPLRFFARPGATELVVRSTSWKDTR
jgi:predicted MPP superfamily phosphohydrolase